MPLINCGKKLMLTWSANCVICEVDRENTFAITNAKLYIAVVTLSTQDNSTLLEQLKSEFKRTINWNKYLSKVSRQAQNQYLGYQIDLNFAVANKLILSFGGNAIRIGHGGYFFPEIEVKDCNVKNCHGSRR